MSAHGAAPPLEVNVSRSAAIRSGRVYTYAEPKRSGPGVERMSPAQRAAMEERYIHEPARKRAAGLCPGTDCTEKAHDPATGRCWRCAARWPAKKVRKGHYRPATDGLTEEVTDVAA